MDLKLLRTLVKPWEAYIKEKKLVHVSIVILQYLVYIRSKLLLVEKVESAGHLVGVVVELTARVELGHHDLKHHVVETGTIIGVTDVHTGALTDRLQALEDLDAVGVIGRGIDINLLVAHEVLRVAVSGFPMWEVGED